MKHFGDIKTLSGYELPIVDVITGGSPCQDLSVAGKRAGLAGERSGLFMEQIRIVREMRERDERDNGRAAWLVRPRYMVWENVPGAFSSGDPKGADFAAVLEEIIKTAEPDASVQVPVPDGGWTKAGCYYSADGRWSIAWRLHDAQFWGVPQRRKRIALVADFGGLTAPEILFERKGLRGDFAESGKAREGNPWRIGGCFETSDRAIHQNGNGEVRTSSSTYSVSTNSNASGRNTPLVFRKKTHPQNEQLPQNWEPALVSDTLNAFDNADTRTPNVVLSVFENHGQDSRYKLLQETSETVSAKYGEGGNNLPLVVSVDCRHGSENADHNLTAQAKKGGHSLNCNITCRVGNHLRRFTPMECERLQGFPDDWSRYGINEKGEVYELPDSARYRLQGNSIAVGYANKKSGFWMWLMKRISSQYERSATLGSLFDGQGGFPLAWEYYNGKGSALWASEIEKHAIAVTKYHFPEEADT